MTRPLLAMFACYALGLVAGRADKTAATSQQVEAILPGHNPVTSGQESRQESRQNGEMPAAETIVPANPAIETPLVAKVLPPITTKVAPSKELSAPKAPGAIAPFDGQLSPRGQWRWSEAQWAWVPVKQSGPAWVQDGHSATIDHLVREHGYKRADLVRLTQQQLDVLHSNAHNSARARRVSAPTYSACPSGRCPRR